MSANPNDASSRPARPKTEPRPVLVELVRLIILALATASGWAIGRSAKLVDTKLSAAIALGALVGYVAGGVFGRTTVTAVTAAERRFQKASAAEILAGTVGLILGLLLAFLLTFPILRLPPLAAYPTTAFVYLILIVTGYRVGSSKRDDFFSMFGLKPRAAGGTSDLTVIDTSALIDGRILDVVRAGFLGGSLLVPDGVLHELRTIGDASDPARRERGRRGLEILERLQRDPSVDVVLVDRVPLNEGDDVDAALVRLARERRAALVTNDVGLAKVAEALDVPVRSVTLLTSSLRPPVTRGQDLEVHIAKTGRESGQGVGYLDDGTMVVVHGAGAHVGDDIHVRVTNITTTTSGRLIFAEVAGAGGG